MAQEIIAGVETQPDPETESRYAEYAALNQEEPESLGSDKEESGQEEANTVGVKAEGTKEEPEVLGNTGESKVTEATDKPSDKGKSGWQRSVDRLTRQRNEERERVRQLEKEIEELKAKKPEEKKISRENFLTDQEYQEAKQKNLVESMLGENERQNAIRQLEQRKEEIQVEGFSSRWALKVEDNFPDEQIRTEYNELIQKVQPKLAKNVHDYLDDSENGPTILLVLAAQPELLKELNQASMIVQLRRLQEIEWNIKNSRTSSPEQPKKTTQAPAPIGEVSANSGVPDEDGESATQAYYRKRQYI